MTDEVTTTALDGSTPERRGSAGRLLREAREKRGLTLATLASSLKVAPRKLDALENDRLDELPDLTFARGLARQICRHLQIDPEPVLALMPSAASHLMPTALEHVAGVKAELASSSAASSRREAGPAGGGVASPAWWLAALLVLGALVIYGWPYDLSALRAWMPGGAEAPTTVSATSPGAVTSTTGITTASLPADAASAAVPVASAMDAAASAPSPQAPTSVSEPATGPIVETVHSSPRGAEAASMGVDAPPVGVLQLRSDGESWVEVRDAGGQVLLSRTLQAGESVGVEGAFPLRATIGNAAATTVTLRGAPVDLVPVTRDNVARLELK